MLIRSKQIFTIILFSYLLLFHISCNQSQKKGNAINYEPTKDITGEYELVEQGHTFNNKQYILIIANKTNYYKGDVLVFSSRSEKSIPPEKRKYRFKYEMQWEYDGKNFYMINNSGTRYHYLANLYKGNNSLILSKMYEGEVEGVGKYRLLDNGTLKDY